MSIDGYGAEFHSFLDGMALMLRRARLCEMAPLLIRHISSDDAIFAHLWENKKYFNNGLDFFIKLVSLLTLKRCALVWRAGFIQGKVPFVKVAPCSMKL